MTRLDPDDPLWLSGALAHPAVRAALAAGAPGDGPEQGEGPERGKGPHGVVTGGSSRVAAGAGADGEERARSRPGAESTAARRHDQNPARAAADPQAKDGAGAVSEPASAAADPQAEHRTGHALQPTPADVPVRATPALIRVAAVLGLVPENRDGRRVLSADALPAAWRAPAFLARLIAQILLSDQPEDALRRRLPRLVGWVASQRRAAGDDLRDPPGVETLTRAEPYGAFFSVETHRLRHRLHGGGWSDPIERAVFLSGDAVVVLPWDRARDRVLLIDQFRAGPALRGDRNPWLIETIAGRIDPGETPEDAARREAVEEAGVTLTDLVPAPHHYPSPGAVAEYLYLYVGLADLPDAETRHGAGADADEDIRGFTVPRAELTRMARAGEIANGPLVILALWLEGEAARLGAV